MRRFDCSCGYCWTDSESTMTAPAGWTRSHGRWWCPDCTPIAQPTTTDELGEIAALLQRFHHGLSLNPCGGDIAVTFGVSEVACAFLASQPAAESLLILHEISGGGVLPSRYTAVERVFVVMGGVSFYAQGRSRGATKAEIAEKLANDKAAIHSPRGSKQTAPS